MSKVSPTALQTFEIFKHLDSTERHAIAVQMQHQAYNSGQSIISSDQLDNQVYFIISGTVRACAYAENGKQVQFEDLRSGMMFGELNALDEMARSNDCIALQNSELALLTADQFNSILDAYPTVRRLVLTRLVKLVRKQMQRVFEFSTTNVANRVGLELLRIASEANCDSNEVVILNPPTHADIAARISTHREAVTRELNKLNSNGIITWNRDTHIIHDINRLMELSVHHS